MNCDIRKRQLAKYLTQNFVLNLIKFNEKSNLVKSYRNSYYCCQNLIINKQKDAFTSVYCKNKWCVVCNRILTAKLFNQYSKRLENAQNLHFVTITLPTVIKRELKPRIAFYNNQFTKILKCLNYNFKNNYFGLRKAECTFNSDTQKFHYHYHILVNSKEVGDFIIQKWLKMNKKASPLAQDIRKADNGSFAELFKYFTKLPVKATKSEFEALDYIFNAFKGKQVFKAFGSLKPVDEEIIELEAIKTTKEVLFLDSFYSWIESDWFGIDTGQAFVNKAVYSGDLNFIRQELSGKLHKRE